MLLGLLVIPTIAGSFAEKSFNGYSSIDPPVSEVMSGQSSVMNIRFLYNSGPYVMESFAPIIEVNPSSARQLVQVDVDSIEIIQGQIKRIPVTLTVDPQIEHDKIFLSISYAGHHFQTGELQKSSWNDQVTLDIIVQDSPVPEPEQGRSTPENCGHDTALYDGICVSDKSQKIQTNSTVKWGSGIDFTPAWQSDHTAVIPIFDDFFSIYEKQVRYNVFYNVTNASIGNVQLRCDSASFSFSILPDDDGAVQLDIPKGMLGGIFMVQINGQEWDDVSIDGNLLTINFPAYEATAEVFGSHYIGIEGQDGVCDIIHNPPYSYILSPLKQIKSGTALFDVKCSEEKSLVYKYDRMRAVCVSEETQSELWDRGWSTIRFYTEEDTSPHALCNNYEGKWHPEHDGCRGDISDLQCSLMGGTFVDNLKICYNDICPENKTYTLCVTNPDESDSNIRSSKPTPDLDSRQCRLGLPPSIYDFYLDKELCKWKPIPEPIPDESIPYVWNSYLQKKQIGFSPKDVSYINTDEGFFPEKENRVCSPLILTNGSEFFISSTFTVEPFEMIDTVMSKIQPDDCHKIWKTEPLLVEPSPELDAWLKKYWEKENED